MIHGKSVLAVIPARGGSKGLRKKNIREVGGKPLIAWTIETAKKSLFIDRLILSSEDSEIIEVATSWGCEVPFIRPTELSRDETPGIEPILHAISILTEYEMVVLLQPTSPQRSVADIDGCIELLVENSAGACVSIAQATENPYWMYKVNDRGVIQPFLSTDQFFGRRQDLPNVYVLNGAIYAARCEWLRKHRTFITKDTLGFLMPRERSLDIDNELDLQEFVRQL